MGQESFRDSQESSVAGGERAREEVRQPVAGPDKDGGFSSGGGRSHCRFMNMVVTGSNFKESFTEQDNRH